MIREEPEGREATIRYDELEAVVIETTSLGPFAEDFFYVLYGPEFSLRVPLGVACDNELVVGRLMDLPGFDHAASIEASGSTEDRSFVVWISDSCASKKAHAW